MYLAVPPRKTRLSVVLLWLGVLALVLHALAGVVHSGTRVAADGLIEVCTPQGMIKLDPATGAETNLQPVSQPEGGQLGCCDLCAACSAPAMAAVGFPLAFNLALATIGARAPPVIAVFHADHPALTPLVPRGPPVLS